MINLSAILMLTGVSVLITGILVYMIIVLYEEWKNGFKAEVFMVLMWLIAVILIVVGVIIYVTYK